MKMIKKSVALLSILFSFLPLVSSAQNPKEIYDLARKAFEDGKNDACLNYLLNCQSALGGSNGKIESLKCQALVMKSDWINAAISYNNYEQLLPSSAKNGEGYLAMLDLHKTILIELAEVDRKEKEKVEKEMQDDLAQAEAQAATEAATINAEEQKQNDENEKKLYEVAMQSKDKELLEIYKKEIGTSTANGKKIALELDKKSSPNSFIIQAVENGDTEEVAYLVELGADKDKKGSNGESLLHLSVSKKDVAMLELLMGLGANIEVQNSAGETPLLAGIKNDFYSGTVKLLDKKAIASAVNSAGKSALFYCLIYNRPGTIKQLTKYGADVNQYITNEAIPMTPLYYSVFISKDQNMAMALLSADANINAYSNTNWTPFIGAVFNGDIGMIKLLMNNHADINKKGPYKWTAMHFAVRQRNIEIINLLVKGADKNAADDWKRTPLKIARERRYKDVIKILKAG